MLDLIKFIDDNTLGDYKENVSFKTLTTYRTGGKARLVYFPFDVDSLKSVLSYMRDNNISFKVFGNGSNILASDDDYDGVIVKLKNFNEMEFLDGKVVVSAGYSLSLLANTVTKMGYSGLDFACGIPATVGGAVYMNAGAYLSDISEVLDRVEFLDDNYEIKCLEKDALDFSYRHSIFMSKNWIILRAYFTLERDSVKEMTDLIEDRKMRRVVSQPLDFPSAGSVFRNPTDMYAGKLIEDCGLKGYNYGGGEISEKHANFIINKNHAKSSDIKYLMDLAHDEVLKKYGIDLYREQELFNFGDK